MTLVTINRGPLLRMMMMMTIVAMTIKAIIAYIKLIMLCMSVFRSPS